MTVENFVQVFDINDSSEKALVLKGIQLGTYRNDILCKWYATQEIQIGDFEKYICKRLEDFVGYEINSSDDIVNASNDCANKGTSISAWMQEWMQKETNEELLPKK